MFLIKSEPTGVVGLNSVHGGRVVGNLQLKQAGQGEQQQDNLTQGKLLSGGDQLSQLRLVVLVEALSTLSFIFRNCLACVKNYSGPSSSLVLRRALLLQA